MAKKLRGGVWVISIILFFVISPSFGCSKSNPINPPDDNLSGENPLRKMIWADSDRPVAVEDEAERRADVSNVVLGREYMIYDIDIIEDSENNLRGYILTHEHDIDMNPQTINPVEELVVFVWAERNEMDYQGGTYVYWEILFQVYGRDYQGGEILSPNFTVDNPLWFPGVGGLIPGSQNYPSVTAHIGDTNPTNEYLDDPMLYIDIAFQRREIWGEHDRWMVYHAQYVATPGDYSSFDLVGGGINRIAPDDPETHYALHPDIVYGTYWGGVDDWDPPNVFDIDYVVAVYEVVRKSTGFADIRLAEYSPRHTPITWSEFWKPIHEGHSTDFIPQYPRVDAGIDCSAHFEPVQAQYYIAAVVWHVLDFTDFPIITATLYYNFKVYNVPWPYVSWRTEFDSFKVATAPNGLPYVEIDPIEYWLENEILTWSHMVWSRFMLEGSDNDIEPWYTNSLEVLWNFEGDNKHWVANAGDNWREGLVTIATYTDQTISYPCENVGTIQYISAYYTDTEYPVYSVDFYFEEEFPGEGGNPEKPVFNPREPVSHGDNPSSDVYPWDCGPSSAMRGGDVTICGWTKREDLGGGVFVYDIYSDEDL